MISLEQGLQDLFTADGWRVYDQGDLRAANLSFEFAAESDNAVVFARTVSGLEIGEFSNRLAGEIASLTLSGYAPLKAWEAYLLLFVSEGYTENVEVAQQIQYDFTFCRRVVLDLQEIQLAPEPDRKLRSDLAFLFPLGVAEKQEVVEVRELLVKKLAASGIDSGLARDLVAGFDETDCKCVERLASASDPNLSQEADE